MKKFSKEHIGKLDDLVGELNAAWAEVEEEKSQIELVLVTLNENITTYNALLEGIREFVEELAGTAEEYQGERSEKWAESDAGQAYQAWIDEIRNVGLDDVEAVNIDELGLPEEPDHAENLSQLPQEPQG